MIILKVYRFLISIFVHVKYKITYGNRFICPISVRLPRTLKIRMNGRAGKVQLKKGVFLREYVCLNVTDGEISIGKNVFLNDFVCINSRASIQIQDNTIIGQGVKMYDHDHDYGSKDIHNNFVTAPISIGKNVWLGSDVIVLKGSNVGDNCVIGAGALVNEDIPDNTLFYNETKNVMNQIVYRDM